jgi:hypothetical protein
MNYHTLKLNNHERCKQLVTAIEKISQNEVEEIFKMIHMYGCSYTKNNNGLFINLTRIPDELLSKIEQYVKFCNRSQTELKKYESICHVLNNKLRDCNNEIIEVAPVSMSNIIVNTDQNILNVNYVDDIDEIENVRNPDIDNDVDMEAEIENEAEVEKITNKISSSMKFSLLKKRYSKISILNTNIIENDLKVEDYIITL